MTDKINSLRRYLLRYHNAAWRLTTAVTARGARVVFTAGRSFITPALTSTLYSQYFFTSLYDRSKTIASNLLLCWLIYGVRWLLFKPMEPQRRL